MHLESTGRQAFVIMGNEVKFEKGETIHTENSYKYSIDEFSGMLKEAGFNDITFWQDSGQRYAPLCGYDLINAVPSFWKFVSGIPYAAFWKLKQDGLRYIYQMKHESLLCKWKLRSLSFLESQLKIGKGTPGLRFRPIASRILIDLRKTMEKCVNNLLHALLESMMRPYWSTMGFLRG